MLLVCQSPRLGKALSSSGNLVSVTGPDEACRVFPRTRRFVKAPESGPKSLYVGFAFADVSNDEGRERTCKSLAPAKSKYVERVKTGR